MRGGRGGEVSKVPMCIGPKPISIGPKQPMCLGGAPGVPVGSATPQKPTRPLSPEADAPETLPVASKRTSIPS